MIKTNLFDKKSLCHALLQSTSEPEILIPVKAIIEDIKLNEDTPLYLIRVIKFYDGIDFLKWGFYDSSFRTSFNLKISRPLKIPKKIKNIVQMEQWLGSESNYRFCVESNLVFKTKAETLEMFDKIQEYLICKKLKFIKRISNRSCYNGPLYNKSFYEFNIRIERGFADLFDNQEEMKNFLATI